MCSYRIRCCSPKKKYINVKKKTDLRSVIYSLLGGLVH